MPGNFMTADTSFPDLSGKGDMKEKLNAISGYLYVLLEQLRYTLGNLGEENFNQTELENIGKTITEPVKIKLQETEEGLTELTVTVGGISSRVEDMDGRFSQVEQDVNGLNIQSAGGTTYITGSHVKTGRILSQNGLSEINLNTGMAKLSGSYQINNPETSETVGGIKYDTNGEGTAQEAKNRMYLYTDSGYAMKLQADGNLSLQGDELIYIKSGRSVVISVGGVRWRFSADGIYRNDQKVLSPA